MEAKFLKSGNMLPEEPMPGVYMPSLERTGRRLKSLAEAFLKFPFLSDDLRRRMPVNETSKYHSYTTPSRLYISLFIISTLEGLLELLTQTVYTRYPIHQIHTHPPVITVVLLLLLRPASRKLINLQFLIVHISQKPPEKNRSSVAVQYLDYTIMPTYTLNCILPILCTAIFISHPSQTTQTSIAFSSPTFSLPFTCIDSLLSRQPASQQVSNQNSALPVATE
uniref:Uncharacterized protein n=1 Tax=Solanum tuberosum TaxID=4113 RepID=M1DLP0_SOLTU